MPLWDQAEAINKHLVMNWNLVNGPTDTDLLQKLLGSLFIRSCFGYSHNEKFCWIEGEQFKWELNTFIQIHPS